MKITYDYIEGLFSAIYEVFRIIPDESSMFCARFKALYLKENAESLTSQLFRTTRRLVETNECTLVISQDSRLFLKIQQRQGKLQVSIEGEDCYLFTEQIAKIQAAVSEYLQN